MNMPEHGLTHIAPDGHAHMVDVGEKPLTARVARAGASLRMAPDTARAIEAADGPKGDVVGPARLAGIMAAKRTADLIPLAHPVALTHVGVTVDIDAAAGVVRIEAEARTTGQTGVEMEAMTACSVAALTVYDMVKGLERGVRITDVRLLEKRGGRNDWRAPDA